MRGVGCEAGAALFATAGVATGETATARRTWIPAVPVASTGTARRTSGSLGPAGLAAVARRTSGSVFVAAVARGGASWAMALPRVIRRTAIALLIWNAIPSAIACKPVGHADPCYPH